MERPDTHIPLMMEQTPQLDSQRTWLDIDRVIESKRKLSKSWSRGGGDKPECRLHWARSRQTEILVNRLETGFQTPVTSVRAPLRGVTSQGPAVLLMAYHPLLTIHLHRGLRFLLLFETANLASLPLCDFIQTFTSEPVP